MKNIIKKYSLLAAVGATTMPMSVVAQQSLKKPNVLMLVVDDWGKYDLSMNNASLYETPNVDRLGSISNNFSEAYVAYPRSVPSRYSLMTGRHCARPQKKSRADNRSVNADSYCIAEPFKAAGYNTFIIGKWHLCHSKTMPTDKGFDISIGAGKAGATGTYFAPFNKPGETKKDKLIVGMEDACPGEYLTDYMTRKTIDYLRAQKDKPFFAICSFYAVHTPLEAKADLTEYFAKKVKDLGLKKDPLMKAEAGFCKTQQDNAVYAAMIASVDEGIGKMIQTLKETGAYDNTIIVLVSDHGGLSNRGRRPRQLATTNAPLRAGKGHLYEGGIKVPFLIHLPGQKKEIKRSELVMNYDLLPTLADLCNAPINAKAEIDGVSLKSLLLKNQNKHLKDRVLFWHKVAQRPNSTGDYVATAIRSGRYKLLDFYNQKKIELYDLVKDPSESNNLVQEYPSLVKKLMNKIESWRFEMKVSMEVFSKGDKNSAKRIKKKAARKAARRAARKANKK